MNINHSKAFTLVETLIALGISTAVIAGVYVAFMTGSQSWVRFSQDTILKNELRRAMTSMTSDLRDAGSITIFEEEGGLMVNFIKPKEGMISYRWNNAGPDSGKIVRIHESAKRVLAHQISSLSFQYPHDNFLLIEVTSGTARQFRLQEQIALRAKTGLFKPAKERNEKTQ